MGQIKTLISVALAAATIIALVGPPSRPVSAFQRRAKQLTNCSNINEILDHCGGQASFSFTTANSAYPTTPAELREACPRNNEGLHCLRQHVKCLKPLTKRAMLAFIDGRRKHVKKVCSDLNGQSAHDFTTLFACIKKHKMQKFVTSEVLAIRRIEAILSDQVKDFKERFQRTCCAITSYRQGSIDDLGRECSSPNLVSAFESAIDSVVGEAVEFACPDPKTGYCTKLKELRLSTGPVSKTLTRSGTDLLIVITEPDDASHTLPPKNFN